MRAPSLLGCLVLLGCDKGPGAASVGNSPPSIPEISLGPDVPTAADDLQVVIVTDAVDPDGDRVEYDVVWSVDGEVFDGATALTLHSRFTFRGDTWSVRVTATDGVNSGGSAGASVSIENSAPTIAEIEVQPSVPYERDTLKCVYSDPIDLDNDEVQELQVWAINGVEIDQQAPLTGADFDKHDEVECLVYADDGIATLVPHRSETVVIQNSLPNVIGCSLAENNPPDNVPLEVISQGFYDEDGDPEGYHLAWYINGVDVSDEATLSPSLMSPGDNVYVECTAWDGEEEGNTATSGNGTVVEG